MTPKNFYKDVNAIIDAASSTTFSLTPEFVVFFICQVIDAVTDELRFLGKTPAHSPKAARAKVHKIFFDKHGDFCDDLEFFSDRDFLMQVFDEVRSILTVPDLRAKDAIIVDRLQHDEKFASDFLFCSPEQPDNIAPLRARFIRNLRKDFGYLMKPEDFSHILYSHLFSFGTWAPLQSYDYRSSFYSWLSTVASHCIVAYLEENGFIKISRARTPGNTRLVLKKMTPDYCHAVIEDMVNIGPMRDMLLAVYVDRLDQETIQKRFDMNKRMYKLTLRASEKTLKTALLNAEHPYDDVLVDKSPRKQMLHSDFLTLIGQTNAAYSEDSPLREVLGVTPDDAAFNDKIIEFLTDFVNKLGWSVDDKYVWSSRFIQKTKSREVAENLQGRDEHWVNNRYSKLQKVFLPAIRKWWASVER